MSRLRSWCSGNFPETHGVITWTHQQSWTTFQKLDALISWLFYSVITLGLKSLASLRTALRGPCRTGRGLWCRLASRVVFQGLMVFRYTFSFSVCCLFFVSWRSWRSAGAVSRTLHARVWSMEKRCHTCTSQQEFLGTFPSDRSSLWLTRLYLTVFSTLHLFYLQLIGLVWNERHHETFMQEVLCK